MINKLYLNTKKGAIMKTITITFEDDNRTVIVTDGRHTSESTFNKIIDETKQAFIALADFYGYEPAHLLDFNGTCEYEFEDDINEDEDDDNDFLEEIAFEAACEETIQIWIDGLLERCGKTSIEELTTDELKAEIEETEGEIDNQNIWALADDMFSDNIINLKGYKDKLETILHQKETAEAERENMWVCSHCLAAITSREGNQATMTHFVDYDDPKESKCDWCEEDGFDVLYELV